MKSTAASKRPPKPTRISAESSSPYSASKAGSDLLARSYFVTYQAARA